MCQECNFTRKSTLQQFFFILVPVHRHRYCHRRHSEPKTIYSLMTLKLLLFFLCGHLRSPVSLFVHFFGDVTALPIHFNSTTIGRWSFCVGTFLRPTFLLLYQQIPATNKCNNNDETYDRCGCGRWKTGGSATHSVRSNFSILCSLFYTFWPVDTHN